MRQFTINSTLFASYYPGNPQSPQYDNDGNMTWDGAVVSGVRDTGLSLSYTYDVDNHLTSVANRDYIVSFTYDYMGRRVRQVTKTNDTAATVKQDLRFVYDGWHLLGSITVSGTSFSLNKRYYWGLDVSGTRGGAGGIGGLVAWANGITFYAPCYDGRGNIVAQYDLTNSHVAAEYEYDPYGKLVRTTGYTLSDTTWSMVSYDPTGCPFKYQTKYHLQDALGVASDSGFTQFDIYDYGQRWYHPRMGRFINQDPIGVSGGANLYNFCGNDPINRFDVLGQSWLSSLNRHIRHSIYRFVERTAINKSIRHLEQRFDRWNENHQREITMVAAIVASCIIGPEVAAMVYTPAMSGSLFTGYTCFSGSTLLTGAVSSGVISSATASTIAATIGGAVGGFAGGVTGAALNGGNLQQSLNAGMKSAEFGAASSLVMSGVFHMYGSTDVTAKNLEYSVVTAGVSHEVDRFAQHELGIPGWEFNLGLEGISYAGYKLFGDPYSYSNKEDGKFIGGYFDRNADDGILFKGNSGFDPFAHQIGEFAFDTNDQILLWQGQPDAGMLAYGYTGRSLPTTGHSEGASRLIVANAWGLIQSGTALATPWGMVARSGIVNCVNPGDFIPGSYASYVFNPEQNSADLGLGVHDADKYFTAFKCK